MPVKPIPDGYHSITPYIIVNGADRFIEFLKSAFDGKEIGRMNRPDGLIAHAEVRIGNSIVMLSESRAEFPAQQVVLYHYVEDADAVYRKALQAGATSTMEPADKFYGDRNAGVKDPFGNTWWIATRREDVPLEELMRRAATKSKQ